MTLTIKNITKTFFFFNNTETLLDFKGTWVRIGGGVLCGSAAREPLVMNLFCVLMVVFVLQGLHLITLYIPTHTHTHRTQTSSCISGKLLKKLCGLY